MLDRIFPHSSEILKLMGEALLVVNASGLIKYATPPADELFGAAPGELIDTPFGVPSVEGEFTELDVISRTGEIKIVQMRCIQAALDEGPVHVLSLRDVTARKCLEQELAKAREDAKAADRAKNNFLANMTHEIRTPMIGILGMTELTMATELTPKQREFLEMVKHSAGALLEILNDVLDYAKIETGKLELAEAPFDLRGTVEDAIRVFTPLAEKKGVKLSWFVDHQAPSHVVGDAGRLRQILVNLVGNAVKFTDKGMVRVECTLEGDAPPRGTEPADLRFSVQDTGIGIPQDKLGAVFDSFTQADDSTSRRYQGAGLGLAIFKHLVEMMGGQVSVKSEEGRGSAFSFRLRLPAAAEVGPLVLPLERQGAQEHLPPLTVLLAEDNPVNQIFISELLEQQGHKVITAHTGRRAIKALKENDVDVVLMDIQMPEMDGVEATRIIRQSGNGRFKADIPIIALTAHALKGDRERFLQAGMNDYLAKPVGLEELSASLAKALGARPSRETPPTIQAAAAAGEPSREILDYPWLLEKARGNKDFLKRLFAAFVNDQPRSLEEIRQALDSGDLDRLGFLAHSLKGAAATMGAGALRAACLALEKSAKSGQADSLCAEFGELEKTMDAVIAAMRERLEESNPPPQAPGASSSAPVR